MSDFEPSLKNPSTIFIDEFLDTQSPSNLTAPLYFHGYTRDPSIDLIKVLPLYTETRLANALLDNVPLPSSMDDPLNSELDIFIDEFLERIDPDKRLLFIARMLKYDGISRDLRLKAFLDERVRLKLLERAILSEQSHTRNGLIRQVEEGDPNHYVVPMLCQRLNFIAKQERRLDDLRNTSEMKSKRSVSSLI